MLLGLSFSSLKIPNSWCFSSYLKGDLSIPSHFLFHDTSPSPLRLSPHQGTMKKIKDGGGRNGSTSLFRSLPHFILGDPCPSATLHFWPLFLDSCSVPFVPSQTRPLCAMHSPVFLQPMPGSCLHCHLSLEASRNHSASPFPSQFSLRFLPLSLFRPTPRTPPFLPRQAQRREGLRNSIKAWSCHGMATFGHPGLPSG